MDKAYSRIVWQNQPSTATAVGATNLNRIDVALNEVDNRVVAMDASKAESSVVNNTVQSITFNDATGVMTITKVNGTSVTIDTKLEKLAVNFSYNPETQQLDITLDDGSVQHVDLSLLVTQYEFEDSDTIMWTLTDGVVKADIINGSIQGEKLQPNYLADIIVQANIATTNASLSKRYAVGGVEEGDETDNAKYYRDQAKQYRDQAQSIVNIDIATDEAAGLVKGGGNVTIDEDGEMNVDLSDVDKLKNVRTATITTTWVGSTAPYTQDITLTGITASDTPIIDIVPTTQEQIDEWSKISKITTGTNKITVTCFEDKPTVFIPIQIKGA